MSAFRARPPKGLRYLTGSQHRRALREQNGVVVTAAEKGKGYPAAAHPTRRRARKNPRWAGIMAGLRYHGHPYAVVPPPQARKPKRARTAPKVLPKRALSALSLAGEAETAGAA